MAWQVEHYGPPPACAVLSQQVRKRLLSAGEWQTAQLSVVSGQKSPPLCVCTRQITHHRKDVEPC